MKSWTPPTPDQVAKAVAGLARVEQRRYFFDKLQNPTWISALKQKRFFANPPAPESNEREGTIRFIPWPESRYLARMAHLAPEEVAQIFLELGPTDNFSVHEDVLAAASQMPTGWASKMAEIELSWISTQPLLYGRYEDRCAALVEHLLKEPEGRRVAFGLAKALLALTKGSGPLIKQPKAKFDNYSFSEAVTKLRTPFVKALGEEGVRFFSDLLEVALRLGNKKAPEDYSYVWRPAIEDHERNDLRDNDIASVLISAVRDAAIQTLDLAPQHAEQIISDLFNRKWRAFRRIAYFLAQTRLTKGSQLLAAMLVSREALEDIGSQHEYSGLLGSKFSALDVVEQRRLLDWIHVGPSYLTKDEEDTDLRRARWQSSRFHVIRAHLAGEDLSAYSKLTKEHGESEPPDFPYKLETSWVGPTSPTTKEDLLKMSDEEVLRLLTHWTPEKKIFSPSRRGLARTLETLIAEHPERMWPLGSQLTHLDPTYVGALLSGLATAAGKDAPFTWIAPLKLCEWVCEQPFEDEREESWDEGDSGWSNSRRVAARLAVAGIRSKGNPIPVELRTQVWSAFHRVTDDPDPTPAHERDYGGTNMGPTTLALNSNRGEAMSAVISYALWVKNHLDATGQWRGFDSVPEVRVTLDKHLDLSLEPSTAIRSIYGEWYPWLHLMDETWSLQNKDVIFPPRSEQALHWEVAWKTYVTHANPYDAMLGALREDYARAIEAIGKTAYETDYVGDPDERLAEHLVVFLVRGKLEFDDPLVLRLFEVAPPPLRQHVINFLGRSLWGDEEVPGNIHSRMRAIWERRLAASRPPADTTELKAFGAWFSAKQEDPAWALPELIKTLRVQPAIDLEFMVMKRLATLSSKMPGETMEALHLLVTKNKDLWRVGIETDAIREILKIALVSGRSTQQLAIGVIEHFGKNGVHAFRDLWPGIASR